MPTKDELLYSFLEASGTGQKALDDALFNFLQTSVGAGNTVSDLFTGGGGGVTDHGALTGLTDDDHTQYHNDARGDARYRLLSVQLGTTDIADLAITTAKIANQAVGTNQIFIGAVSNAKMNNMANSTVKGRISAGAGAPEDLNSTQLTALVNVFDASLAGLAPASGGGTTTFLRADGTWAAPPGGGGGLSHPEIMARVSLGF